jgi:AAA domain
MRIVILCGLPGVGKLTIAKGLARLRGYRVFHNHLVFDAVEALFPFGSPAFIELRERLWLELLARSVRERVGDVIFTIARDQSLHAEFLVTLVAALSEMGARVSCIELICGMSELEQRLASADRAHYGKIISVERFRQLSADGAFPRFTMPAETISLDMSGLSPGEAVAAVDANVNLA